ncbi:hypothetical protein BD410DRAFT_901546 [Rickenella mellea]|uniref:peptidylprolyl isomerase n=1 Tax=Rickenella mellea TaxID=50990 RepID=A0A4Y7PS13_9AGAM|nr:hypothetical protein BD410DRAFT_901546 [Rickenella mellea]
MSISIAIWSLVVAPGKKATFSPVGDVRILNVALGEKIADETSRTTVKLTYDAPTSSDDDEPARVTTILCSLTPGKIEQANLDIVLAEQEDFEIEVVGKNTVYLTGNYIDQTVANGPDDFDDMSSEDEFDLRDVSSDVEIDPNELEVPSDTDAERFEEVTSDANSSSLKRKSDAMDVEPTSAAEKKSKKEKKKEKKLKAADGTAVAAGETPEKPASKANGEKKEKEKKKKEKDGSSPAKEAGEKKVVEGGLKIEDKKVGTGPKAKKGDKVSMRYIGKLDNGKVFDKNTNGKPFIFSLGGGEVIKGWDEGILGMQPGGERLLVVPPKLGYGNRKSADIPAGSTLTFEVKLLEIK